MKDSTYKGLLLWVDLKNRRIQSMTLERSVLKHFIGGRGVGIKLLSDLAPAGVDPLTADNPLIFATGPYTGLGVFSAFFNVTTKSPLTGLATASHCGGRWGPWLRKSGIDGIVISHQSTEPCYLMIHDGRAELKTAADLWGKGVFDTESAIREREGQDVEVIAIGQAGENLVRYAAIMNGHRAAGRSGVGAVMGSKRLKAIAVEGHSAIGSADPEKVSLISRKGGKTAVQAGATFGKYGSSMAFDVFNEANALPTRNFRSGHFEAADKINAQALKSKYFKKNRGCYKCPLRCGNLHSVPSGSYRINELEGPEYETLMSFGSNCDNSNLESILMANYLCNDFGIDTISCGQLFALLMDLFDLSLISSNQLDGHSMNWGDHEAIVAMIPKIAHRQGVGDLLAEGSYRTAMDFGSNALKRVIHCKQQEYPGYESRRSFATGFSLATSNRGACHLRSTIYVNEIFAGEFNVDGFENHIDTLLDKEHLLAIADSFLTCKFGMRNAQFTWPVLTELFNALTGHAFSETDLKTAGERIWNLERLFNLREGVEPDMIAQRLFEEDLDDGKAGGRAISMERFLSVRQKYYEARGWDGSGIPSRKKLQQLGL